MKPEDISAFTIVNAVMKWLTYLVMSLLFYWLFLGTLDKWVMTLLAIFKH